LAIKIHIETAKVLKGLKRKYLNNASKIERR